MHRPGHTNHPTGRLRDPRTAALAILLAIAAIWVFVLRPPLPDLRPLSNADIRHAVRAAASAEDLNARIAGALAEDDTATAVAYADLAHLVGYRIEAGLRTDLETSTGWAPSAWRSLRRFARGFITGEAQTIEELTGVISSDLTMVGDFRDLATEGHKLVHDQDYDRTTLALSAVGIGLTAATYGSGGTALPARTSLSAAKAVYRSPTVTQAFRAHFLRLLDESVDHEALRKRLSRLDMSRTDEVRKSLADYAREIKDSRFYKLLRLMKVLKKSVGWADALRLMAVVQTTQDLKDLVETAQHLGPRTRTVVETTGTFRLPEIRRRRTLVASFGHHAGMTLMLLAGLAGTGWLTRRMRASA